MNGRASISRLRRRKQTPKDMLREHAGRRAGEDKEQRAEAELVDGEDADNYFLLRFE